MGTLARVDIAMGTSGVCGRDEFFVSFEMLCAEDAILGTVSFIDESTGSIISACRDAF